MPRNVLIKIRRGAEAQLPTLDVGELGYCTDTNKLYIGTPAGNQLLVAAQSVGDMLKSIYDTDSDGKVDAAETADSVPWSGVSGKPSTFSPQAHANSHASGGSDPVTPAMIGAVNKSGDTMAGELTFQGYSIRINRPNTTGGWARGIHQQSKDGAITEAGIGFYGSGDNPPDTLYMGFGTSPWNTSSGLVVKADNAYFKGNKVWHSGNDGAGSGLDADLLDGKQATDFMPKGPITWNQLKGV